MKRCHWVTNDKLYIKYHDEEWGKPVYEETKLFEYLLLETFQAGLSWLTILKKREGFRKAFDGFDYHKIANYTENKHFKLLQDKSIVRNKLKIKAATTNAQAFLKVQQDNGTFRKYIWSYVGEKPIINHFKEKIEIPTQTPISDQISKDLKKRGFKFVGSTTIYAFMQATGMVNDHILNCSFRHK